MTLENIPFQTIDWTNIPRMVMMGENGYAFRQQISMGTITISLYEYSGGYIADSWNHPGHLVYCLDGMFINELPHGEKHFIKKGMSYITTGEASKHRSATLTGARLLVIEGLQYQAVKMTG